MNSTGIIIILIVIIICILVTLYINMYNKLTFSNIKINETEAQIDSKLRKKYDLINKSIAIIKNNIEEENKVFEEIIKLRSRKISNFDLDRKLAEATTEFFTIKEKNKDLQNNEEIKKIGTELEEIDIFFIFFIIFLIIFFKHICFFCFFFFISYFLLRLFLFFFVKYI